MSKNHQEQHRIDQILAIFDDNPINALLRNRLITNTDDQIGIISGNYQLAQKQKQQRVNIHQISLKQPDNLAQLLRKKEYKLAYINLSNPNVDLIHNIFLAMENCRLNRIILVISSKNGPRINEIANLIKKSQLKYTIIRTARINRGHLLSYQVVKNAQPVNDSSVSTDSVADLAFQTIKNPNLHINEDLGIAQLPYK